MMHPKTYLTKKTIGYKTNGLESLGHLHAKHFDDIAKVMEQFTEETIIEVVERLNKGENIKIGECILSLNQNKSFSSAISK